MEAGARGEGESTHGQSSIHLMIGCKKLLAMAEFHKPAYCAVCAYVEGIGEIVQTTSHRWIISVGKGLEI